MSTSPQRGFTLLEMIVAVGLFSVVMLVATAAYFNLIALDRQARSTNSLSANLNFAVDSMGRALRTGYGYACNGNSGAPNCTSGGTSIAFTDSSGRSIVYIRTSSTATVPNALGECINPSGGICNDSNAIPITDPSITIASGGLTFYVRGVGNSSSPENNQQPQVTISIRGTMPSDNMGHVTEFVIETSATERLLEI